MRATGAVAAAESSLCLVRASRSEYSPDILSFVVAQVREGGAILYLKEGRKKEQFTRLNDRMPGPYIHEEPLSLAALHKARGV